MTRSEKLLKLCALRREITSLNSERDWPRLEWVQVPGNRGAGYYELVKG